MSKTQTAQHTPGPCSIDRLGDVYHVLCRGEVLSTCSTFQAAKLRQATLNSFWRQMGGPDLLAACELLLGQYEQICEDNDVLGWPAMIRDAKAAIAKARA